MTSIEITHVNQQPRQGCHTLAEGQPTRLTVVIQPCAAIDEHEIRWLGDGRPLLRPPQLVAEPARSPDHATIEFVWCCEAVGDDFHLEAHLHDPKAPNLVVSGKVRIKVAQATLRSHKTIANLQGLERVVGPELLDRVREGAVPISLQRSATSVGSPQDETLWVQILATTRATSFQRFADAMKVFNNDEMTLGGTRAYDALKECASDFTRARYPLHPDSAEVTTAATEALSRLGRAVDLDRSSVPANPNSTLPNIGAVSGRISDVGDTSHTHVQRWDPRTHWRKLCLVELIWSYWHEEGMLVQSLKAISRRFQNRRLAGPRDPLANLEIDPLRPLSNVLWGYVGDEVHRLSVLRRAHEYEHHYGLAIEGAATASLRPADRRSRFLEYFHNLLNACAQFFMRDDDNTIKADGFPMLNAIKALHYLIAEGAHNQFGDLPETARYEMLIEQWIMARPEMRDFLRGRTMVPYPEPWMDTVDAMKTLQGWSDASVIYFHDLGVFGEQILLSVRHGSWAAQTNPAVAVAWARFWRQELQGYMHAYRAVTGVDLSVDQVGMRAARERDLPPSVHLRRRLTTPGAF